MAVTTAESGAMGEVQRRRYRRPSPYPTWFYLPAAATKTIDARWTSGTNRSAAAPYIIKNTSGTTLATVYKNQQTGGGAWNTLGSWSFPAGWNKVQLSRWAPEGYVVVADAIQVR